MNTYFLRGRARRWGLAALLLCCCRLGAQETPVMVELDAAPVSGGGSVFLHLVVLNPSPAPFTHSFPGQVGAVLLAGPVREEVVFLPVDVAGIAAVAVPPRGFGRRQYSARVPDRLSGPVRLEIAVEPVPSFNLNILPSDSAGTDTGASPTRRVTFREGMDRETPETSFFRRHVFPYEPFYFIAGPDAPAAKFQVSFKYRLVNTEAGDDGVPEGWLYRNAPWMDGLHLAYSQRSLWDLEAESAPFLDSSYMPELLYERPNLIDPEHGWLERIGAQIGFQHESNGKDGTSSRSLNIAYARIPFVFGDEENFYVSVEPRAWFYVGDLTDNPDLADYRGHLDLRLKAGWARGLQVAGWLRAGREFDRGSAQVDVTYPLHNLLSRSFSLYLQGQYFNGYGESLLYYNERSEVWRLGIGLFR